MQREITFDNNEDPDSVKFCDLLESVGLRQHVNQATHVNDHTLDLIITRFSDDIMDGRPGIDRFISDHAAVVCHLAAPTSLISYRKITYRKLKSVDRDVLREDLAATSLCTSRYCETEYRRDENSIDALAHEYNLTLKKLTDRHAPLKTKVLRARPSAPWYNADIDAAKRRRRKAERVWRKSKSLADFTEFKSSRNRVTYLINKAKKTYYTDFISDNSENQGKLFRAASKLLITKNELNFPNYTNNTALCNDIGEFFVRKVSKIRSDVDRPVLDEESCTPVPSDRCVPSDGSVTLESFRLLSEEEVRALVIASPKKYCDLDPMPMPLVIDCLELLLPIITHLVNSSLINGYFPTDWKEALVKPLLKKPGLAALFNHLRPISNLQFISKLVERAVYDQIYDHLMLHDLFPEYQSAYRQGYSTETALLKVQNDILLNMDCQQVTLLVLLDLSAAFDTVDHSILLHRLETSFGITGTVRKWFESYLSGRCQRIAFKDGISDIFPLTCGVPQGSCLGPLLFTMYASKLFDVIKEHLPTAHAYADDTQLYLSFKPGNGASEEESIAAMETCIKAVRTWMTKDKLKLNDSKTEFLIIGTRQQLKKVNIVSLPVGDVNITPVASARNLGTVFDSNLCLVPHINNTCRQAFFHLHNIRRIRKYLSVDATKILVHAFIMGRVDYCNSLLYGLPAKSVNKLQRVQNAAARLVSGASRFNHITPVLYELHWLPVKERIIFKISVLTFKAIHGLAPSYISEMVTVMRPSSYQLRRNKELLIEPANNRNTKKTLGDRAFSFAAPTVFNALPHFIRRDSNFNSFKSSLKTYLFQIAYCT